MQARSKPLKTYSKKRPRIPNTLAKFFKLTPQAQRLTERLCALDSSSHQRELVYSTYPEDAEWDELNWSQAKMAKRAVEVTNLQIARKKPDGLTFDIRQSDMTRGLHGYGNNSRPDDHRDSTKDVILTSATLGFQQAKREWIYLISMVVEDEDHEQQAAGDGDKSLRTSDDDEKYLVRGVDKIDGEVSNHATDGIARPM